MLLRARIKTALLSTVLVLTLAGCKSDYDRAVEKAKLDAVSTGQPQQVISVDKNGTTTVTVVQPPATPGQAVSVSTNTAPAGQPALPAGQPDYSNGAHPAPGTTAVFSGPKPGAVATAAPAVPAAAAPDAPAADTPGSATIAEIPPPTAFVPTNVTIPAGTGLAIRLNQTISVKHDHAGEHFSGALAESISRDGKVVLPRGTRVNGIVTEAHKRGHFKGRSELGLRLTSISYDGKNYPLETASFVSSKKGKGKRSGAFIAGGTGVGMLIGGLASGGLGVAAGGAAGGGLGTLLAGVTGNRDIVLPAESLVRFRLADDLTVQPAE